MSHHIIIWEGLCLCRPSPDTTVHASQAVRTYLKAGITSFIRRLNCPFWSKEVRRTVISLAPASAKARSFSMTSRGLP